MPTLGGLAFGSYWRVSGVGGPGAERLRARIEAIVASIDRRLSPYRADSEITRFNASRSGNWFKVSPETQTVVAAALSMAQRCKGSFDPTVGPLVGRYGFGPIVGSRAGHHRQLSVDASAIRKDAAELSLDLCGIAKGYALDRMVQDLDGAGFEDYLIELGGEVFARGRHPSARPWQVAIEDPRPGIAGLTCMVALDGQAIATSGVKVNSYAVGGKRYGHIIDPLASSAVVSDLLSVSVVAEQAMAADGLATGMMAMGAQRAAAFANHQQVDALLLVRAGRGLRRIACGRFAQRIIG